MWILFEGPESTGKSTQAAKLKSSLEKITEREIILTKEPGCPDLDICVNIRKMLLDPNTNLSPESELLLFLADRAEHMSKVIIPSLKAGKIVISDRSSLSTLCYHHASKNDENYKLNELYGFINYVHFGYSPDICFIAGFEDEKWQTEMMKSRGMDRIEQRGSDFHSRVSEFFRTIMMRTDMVSELFFPKEVIHLPLIPAYTAETISELTLIYAKERLNK